MEEFIQNELNAAFKTLRHHIELTGILPELQMSKFVSIKKDILYLAKLFSFLDDNFENELIQKMYLDIVSLIHFVEMLGSQKQIEIYYGQYKDENAEALEEFDDFKHALTQAIKINKLKTVSILNTKLCYFDLLIWENALSSKKIVKYLFSASMSSAKDTHQFLLLYKILNPKNTNPIQQLNFVVEIKDLYVEYTIKELEYLKSLKIHNENLEVEENLQKLIKFKSKIKFFNNMEDEDIRFIVKNVNFIQFNAHEIIIQQDSIDEMIYFVLNGECRVTVGNKNVGTIEQHKIFGEFASITKERRSATIRANKPTTLLSFELAFEKFNNNPYSFAYLYKNITKELIDKINLNNKKKY